MDVDLCQLMPQGVLNVVNTVRMSGMKMELEYKELEERFRTRLLYADSGDQAEFKAELSDASRIEGKWKQLVDDADLVDASLEETKKQFSLTTKQQVQDFQDVVVAFKDRYLAEGPGLTSITLDQVSRIGSRACTPRGTHMEHSGS